MSGVTCQQLDTGSATMFNYVCRSHAHVQVDNLDSIDECRDFNQRETGIILL